MGSDLMHLEKRARWAYERGRSRRALLGVAPLVVIVTAALCFAHRPMSTLWFGLAAIAVGAVMLWYGRDPQRAVLPGIAAGLVPLVLGLWANQAHGCASGACSSMCVPACVTGGVVAGFAVAAVGNLRGAGAWFWLSASSLALLTGAMGCACMGYSGVAALGAGFAVGVAPGLVRRSFAAKSS